MAPNTYLYSVELRRVTTLLQVALGRLLREHFIDVDGQSSTLRPLSDPYDAPWDKRIDF